MPRTANFLPIFLLGIFILHPSSLILSTPKPNVLFIAIDDLNHWGIGGRQNVHTPNIDRLASRGTLFTNAHCAAPACNPSRASVLTGIHPANSGVYLNNQDWRENNLLKDAPTIPDHFRAHGYKTLGGGKIYHAASLNEKGYTGLLDPEPWDEYFPSKERQMPLEIDPDPVPAHGSMAFYKGHFDWAELDIDDGEMADGKVVTWAERQLTQTHDQPLFLAVGIYRPHIPFYTPKKYFDLYPLEGIQLPEIREDDLADIPDAGQAMARRDWQQWMIDNDQWKPFVRAYLASVSFADAMVGRLLFALENGPMAENTIVVLWSDHGYHLGHKEHWEKFALWEQTTKVAMIMSAPGIAPSQPCNTPVSLIDIYPTLAELTGTQAPDNLDGQSLVARMENPNKATNRTVLITQGRGNHAIRSQRHRYIRYEDGTEELYDHAKDPHEFTNLATLPEHAPTLEAHRAQLPTHNATPDPESSWKTSKKK